MSSEKRDLNSSKIYHILPKEKAKKKKKKPAYNSLISTRLSNIAKQKLLPQTELRQYKQFLKHHLPKFGWLLKKQSYKILSFERSLFK